MQEWSFWPGDQSKTEVAEMLVLSRKVGEMLLVGEGIQIVVTKVTGTRVSLGIVAPDDVRIVRAEIADTDCFGTDLRGRDSSRQEAATLSHA